MSTENKLPIKFKEDWCAALESGEYKQGAGYLHNHDNDTYCCLGVAGLLCGIPAREMDGDSSLSDEYVGYPIPAAISGLMRANPIVEILAEMNDYSGKSFPEIAAYIRENL